jgi:hypothetical protein
VGYEELVAVCERSFGRNWFLDGYGYVVAIFDLKEGVPAITLGV